MPANTDGFHFQDVGNLVLQLVPANTDGFHFQDVGMLVFATVSYNAIACACQY